MAPPAEHSVWWKLRRLRPGEILALGEALILLQLAALAVRRLPFARLGRLASRPIAHPLPDGERREMLVDRICWAVWVAAKRSRMRALCFERGLTAQLMLRRRGIDSTLYFGVAPGSAVPGSTKPLDAHVWVKDREIDVMGAEIAASYATLATCPPGRHRPTS